MSTTVTEKYGSPEITSGDNASIVVHSTVRGTHDTPTAEAALLAATPAIYGVLVFQSFDLTPVHIDENNDDACIWDAAAHYGRRTPLSASAEAVTTGTATPPVAQFSFDTSGGTQHITQSLETKRSYPSSPAPTDFEEAIGVHGDNVEGVDITVPVYNWIETHYIPIVYVNAAYKAAIFATTGKTNNATFRGVAAGEVLFQGASGSLRTTGDWEITFRFAASPTVRNKTVGTMTGIVKGGWEYLWVAYEKDKDQPDAPSVPIGVYVEKVYESADFSLLGIGT